MEETDEQINTKKKQKQATIVDVAKQAKVAISTVSHVINGTASISDKTKQKVLDVIAELDYKPNILARSLRQMKSNIIGVIVPDIENEFYANATSEIFRIAGSYSDTIFMIDTGYSYEREKIDIEALVQRQVQGLIFLGGSKDENLIDWAYQENVPVVLGDRRYKDYPSVEFDNFETMRNLVIWTFNKGYRRIGYISESIDMTNLQDRYNGMREGLNHCGLTFNEQWVLNDSWLRLEKLNAAKKVMQKLLKDIERKNMPEIFLTSSDMIAVGIMDALIQNGYQIPDDIAVVGYDDIRLVQYYNPPITTVRQDCKQLGASCYQLLKDSMEGNAQNKHIILKNNIIERKSVKIKKEEN
jgi:LacI family transcriptional regulator